jgi:hypothetical protein
LRDTWDVVISHDEATKLPRRIDGVLPAGSIVNPQGRDEYKLVLLIKDRHPSAFFPASELNLSLPGGTPLYSLDD